MMIKAARENFVFDKHRRRFETIFAFELPNYRAVLFVEAIHVAIRRRKVDAIIFDRRLARPGGATPRIFVKTSADKSGFDFPDNFEIAVFPGTTTEEISLAVSQPHGDGRGRLRFLNPRPGFTFRRGFSATADEGADGD